jgi:hypothetical protein
MDLLSLLESLSAVSDLVAAGAVVISLVYVAKQLHQNTNALRASAAWDSEVTFAHTNMETARNSQFAALAPKINNVDATIEDFSEAEVGQLYFAVRGSLQFAQAQWWLWKSGNLPDELWEYRSKWAKNFISAPVINAVWQTEVEQHIFAQGFVECIEAVEQQGTLSASPAQSESSTQ